MSEHAADPIRVLIVDDHPVVRTGLLGMLAGEPDLEPIGEAADGAAGVALAARLRPHVVLMDLRMPRRDGVAATRRITTRWPRVQVLVLTTYDDDELVFRSIEAGASGYLLKSAPPQRIADAIRRTLAGESPLDQELSMRLLTDLMGERRGEPRGPTSSAAPNGVSEEPPEAPPAESPLSSLLSAREAEVLRLMGQGYTNQQIARELLISTSTVKNHVQRVLAKLGASDRTQAAVIAVEMGLISAP